MSSKFKHLLDAAREPELQPETSKRKGRPKGKRSNPDYEQVTAYIRKTTHRDVKLALLQAGEDQDFSDLVEELLTEYLSTQKFKNSKV